MIMPVLQYPDPLLTRKAELITQITPELRTLAADMVETMYARDGIGLAAPQVGQAIRLVVIDVSGPEKREDLRVLINPVLTLSGEDVESEEGCLSVSNYRATVCRKEQVHLEAQDLDGNPLSLDADGLLAICVQHECDHLEGTLFIDHISRLKRSMFDRKIQKKGKA
jgi:peptide deformylase